MIVLDPKSVGRIDRAAPEVIAQERKEEEAAGAAGKSLKTKNKQRGRNKIGRKLKKMRGNVISEEREKLRKKLEEMQKEKLEKQQATKQSEEAEMIAQGKQPSALTRFNR
eukprot:CAMPEP_0204855284 /NCGR_PEP_ID=MMETSP1347-20130617/16510_1 /ASSEMBLY_ACC=CAM_ASM_000690 /TAXON_ID=215587 /ORGANISM="Aplanochytrium stocchinoi, Strain GSBS06" /LENGTH=109 /DNA_ID=CAMNT_0052001315 /DNA_START=45 /DNA_END=374 /DNA_ORIENTATION=-